MDKWKIEYFRLTYLPKDGIFTNAMVVEEANDWLSVMPDTFEQPMALSFKKGWDARERVYDKEEEEISNLKGD